MQSESLKMWLYGHYQPSNEKNMLINSHLIDTKMPFLICYSDQASEGYLLLICSGIIELLTWSTIEIALCKGAVAQSLLLSGYCCCQTSEGSLEGIKSGYQRDVTVCMSCCFFIQCNSAEEILKIKCNTLEKKLIFPHAWFSHAFFVLRFIIFDSIKL